MNKNSLYDCNLTTQCTRMYAKYHFLYLLPFLDIMELPTADIDLILHYNPVIHKNELLQSCHKISNNHLFFIFSSLWMRYTIQQDSMCQKRKMKNLNHLSKLKHSQFYPQQGKFQFETSDKK